MQRQIKFTIVPTTPMLRHVMDKKDQWCCTCCHRGYGASEECGPYEMAVYTERETIHGLMFIKDRPLIYGHLECLMQLKEDILLKETNYMEATG